MHNCFPVNFTKVFKTAEIHDIITKHDIIRRFYTNCLFSSMHFNTYSAVITAVERIEIRMIISTKWVGKTLLILTHTRKNPKPETTRSPLKTQNLNPEHVWEVYGNFKWDFTLITSMPPTLLLLENQNFLKKWNLSNINTPIQFSKYTVFNYEVSFWPCPISGKGTQDVNYDKTYPTRYTAVVEIIRLNLLYWVYKEKI